MGARSDTVEAIDNEIKSLEATIQALKCRRNMLVPISRLPAEILTAIFSLVSHSAWAQKFGRMEWIGVAQVCHQWREIALNYPHFWSYIDLTNVTAAHMAKILARTEMLPLHLKGQRLEWDPMWYDHFLIQVGLHISHTRHLVIHADLGTVFRRWRLASSAPILESLSLTHGSSSGTSQIAIPGTLFNRTAPRLTSLKLENCAISPKFPFLNSLRSLEITDAMLGREDWLDILNEMPQLETLTFLSASDIDLSLIPEPNINLHLIPNYQSQRTVTLPSLAHFSITSWVRGCAFALAHLVLPALTSLRVDAQCCNWGGDIRELIPYVVRNSYGPQDADPLRSISVDGMRTRAEILAWTVPETGFEVHGSTTLLGTPSSARVAFSATCTRWPRGMNTAILDTMLAAFPTDFIRDLTVQGLTRLGKGVWLNHASRWPLLQQARLVPTALKAFREMLAEEAPSNGPRLPSLTKLILVNDSLTVARTYHFLDMLKERVKQGVPFQALDLRTCVAADHAIKLLTEIVVDVQGPEVPLEVEGDPAFFNWNREAGTVEDEENEDDGADKNVYYGPDRYFGLDDLSYGSFDYGAYGINPP
ncbi:hypothetical protein BC826DRAFT_971340 [Russula brevipes]|nr:hypothetical protein BC826DRAFT_971340 [Russula brevipes]